MLLPPKLALILFTTIEYIYSHVLHFICLYTLIKQSNVVGYIILINVCLNLYYPYRIIIFSTSAFEFMFLLHTYGSWFHRKTHDRVQRTSIGHGKSTFLCIFILICMCVNLHIYSYFYNEY